MLEYWSGKEKALVFGLIAALVVAAVLLASPHIPALRPAAEALGMAVPVYRTVYINNTVPVYINRTVPVYINRTVYLNRTVYINNTVPVYINRTVYQEVYKPVDAGTCSGRLVVFPVRDPWMPRSWIAWIWLMPKSYFQRMQYVEVEQYNSTTHVAKFRWSGTTYFVGGGSALPTWGSCDIINATINGYYVSVCRGGIGPSLAGSYYLYSGNGTLMAYMQVHLNALAVTVDVNYGGLMRLLGLNSSIINEYSTMNATFYTPPLSNDTYTFMTVLESTPPATNATSNSMPMDVGPICKLTMTYFSGYSYDYNATWWLPISENSTYIEYLKDAFIQLQGHYDPRYGAIGYRG